ncbi:hypothetical protein A2U01_0113091, partial [Trifolium medium]|nr:hypothetical protein [Trifolium medium]
KWQGKMAFWRKLAKNSVKLAICRPAKGGDSWQSDGTRVSKLVGGGRFSRPARILVARRACAGRPV